MIKVTKIIGFCNSISHKRILETKIEADKGVVKKKIGRPRLNLVTLLTTILKFILIGCMLGFVSGQNINYYRSSERMSLIDLEDLCNFKPDKYEVENTAALSNVIKDPVILNKMHSEVSGAGYRCYARRKQYAYKRSFFSVDTLIETEWMNLKPTVEDGWSMVHTGRCRVESNKFEYDKRMKCTQDKCEIYEVPDPKYNWMNENVLQGYDCPGEVKTRT